MTDTIGITTVISELSTRGGLTSLGRSAFQLALIVGCVVLIRRILKKMGDKTKGPGIKVGWSVDQAEEQKRLEQENEQE